MRDAARSALALLALLCAAHGVSMPNAARSAPLAPLALLALLSGAQHVSATCAEGQPTRNTTVVHTVRLGALFNVFNGEGATAVYGPAIDKLATLQLAIDSLNNKSDGVLDHLLPNTHLLVAYADSKASRTAAYSGARRLLEQSFDGLGVSAVIGAAVSGASIEATKATGLRHVPQ
eukprot:2513089-Prymnesium_polylepis.1